MSVPGKTSKGRRRSGASVLPGPAFLSPPLWWLEASALAAFWFVSRCLPVLKKGLNLSETCTASPARGLRPTRAPRGFTQKGAEASQLDPAA